MAHGTDAADPFHKVGHFVERPPYAEPFESAELCDVEIRIGDLALIVETRYSGNHMRRRREH